MASNFFHPLFCIIKVMMTCEVCSICLSAYVYLITFFVYFFKTNHSVCESGLYFLLLSSSISDYLRERTMPFSTHLGCHILASLYIWDDFWLFPTRCSCLAFWNTCLFVPPFVCWLVLFPPLEMFLLSTSSYKTLHLQFQEALFPYISIQADFSSNPHCSYIQYLTLQ